MLNVRLKKREGWELRQRDRVFRTLPPDCRPMPVPLYNINHYGQANGDNNSKEFDQKRNAEVRRSKVSASELAADISKLKSAVAN